MKYHYAYKTSEGKRLTDSMEARSREEVFEALRGRGIKPIKVVAADGSKANGEIRGVRKRVVALVAIVSAALTVAALLGYRRTKVAPTPVYSQSESFILNDMMSNWRLLESNFVSRLTQLDIRPLRDYSFVSDDAELIAETNRLVAAIALIEKAKQRSKGIFSSVPNVLNIESDAARDAQAKYGQWMDELETKEVAFDNRLRALLFLKENGGGMTLRDGKVSFSQGHLQTQFDFLDKSLDVTPNVKRWHQDFDR